MLALCLILSKTYYSQNYTAIANRPKDAPMFILVLVLAILVLVLAILVLILEHISVIAKKYYTNQYNISNIMSNDISSVGKTC